LKKITRPDGPAPITSTSTRVGSESVILRTRSQIRKKTTAREIIVKNSLSTLETDNEQDKEGEALQAEYDSLYVIATPQH
jgi:hypothetical protein